MKRSNLTLHTAALAMGLAFSAVSLPEANAANAANGAKTFTTAGCPACHGPKGAGDGPASASLNPKPRKFTDAKVMSKLSDPYIAKVIKVGGAAVKKSPAMPPNPTLTPAQINDLVAHLRVLCKCKGPAK